MCARFTKQARSIVAGSVDIAEDQDADELCPEHLFGALLFEDNPALQVLAGLGAPPDRLRPELGAGLSDPRW